MIVMVKTRKIEAVMGAVSEKVSSLKPVFAWLKKHMPYLQVAALLLMFGSFVYGFKFYEQRIKEFNASLTEEQLLTQKINSYNDANIQRIFFERMLQITDLFLCFGFIMIIAPSILAYVMPFLPTKKDFYTEFFNELTAWQRVLSFLILLSSLLLYFALGHTVNTF